LRTTSSLAKNRRRAAWSKSRLATRSAKRACKVRRLAALQQDDDDQHKTIHHKKVVSSQPAKRNPTAMIPSPTSSEIPHFIQPGIAYS